MGLFSTVLTGTAQTKRDLAIARRRATRASKRRLDDQLLVAGGFALDLDQALRDQASRDGVEARGLVEALKVAVETAELALDEVVRLRAEVEALRKR